MKKKNSNSQPNDELRSVQDTLWSMFRKPVTAIVAIRCIGNGEQCGLFRSGADQGKFIFSKQKTNTNGNIKQLEKKHTNASKCNYSFNM